MRKSLKTDRSYYRRYWNTIEYCLELDGRGWKLVETTSFCTVLGSVNPYSYLYCHMRPRDLWCQRWAISFFQHHNVYCKIKGQVLLVNLQCFLLGCLCDIIMFLLGHLLSIVILLYFSYHKNTSFIIFNCNLNKL